MSSIQASPAIFGAWSSSVLILYVLSGIACFFLAVLLLNVFGVGGDGPFADGAFAVEASILIGHNILFGWALPLRGLLRDLASLLHDRCLLSSRADAQCWQGGGGAGLFYTDRGSVDEEKGLGAQWFSRPSWRWMDAATLTLNSAARTATLAFGPGSSSSAAVIALGDYSIKHVTAARSPLWFAVLVAAPALCVSGAGHYAILLNESLLSPGDSDWGVTLFATLTPLVLFGVLSRPAPLRTRHTDTAFSSWCLWGRNLLVFFVSVTIPVLLIANFDPSPAWVGGGGLAGLVLSLIAQAFAILPPLIRIPTHATIALVPRTSDASDSRPTYFLSFGSSAVRDQKVRQLGLLSTGNLKGVSIDYLEGVVGRLERPCAFCLPDPPPADVQFVYAVRAAIKEAETGLKAWAKAATLEANARQQLEAAQITLRNARRRDDAPGVAAAEEAAAQLHDELEEAAKSAYMKCRLAATKARCAAAAAGEIRGFHLGHRRASLERWLEVVYNRAAAAVAVIGSENSARVLFGMGPPAASAPLSDAVVAANDAIRRAADAVLSAATTARSLDVVAANTATNLMMEAALTAASAAASAESNLISVKERLGEDAWLNPVAAFVTAKDQTAVAAAEALDAAKRAFGLQDVEDRIADALRAVEVLGSKIADPQGSAAAKGSYAALFNMGFISCTRQPKACAYSEKLAFSSEYPDGVREATSKVVYNFIKPACALQLVEEEGVEGGGGGALRPALSEPSPLHVGDGSSKRPVVTNVTEATREYYLSAFPEPRSLIGLYERQRPELESGGIGRAVADEASLRRVLGGRLVADSSLGDDRLFKMDDAELGPATTFVSHTWSQSFPELVATLRAHTKLTEFTGTVFAPLLASFDWHFRTTGNAGEPSLLQERPKRYWIDMWNKDQMAADPAALGFKGKALEERKKRYSQLTLDEFDTNVHATGSTELIANGLSDGRVPPALGRVWCLFEIHTSIRLSRLSLLQDPKGIVDPHALDRLAIRVEMEKSEATVIDDIDLVFGEVRKMQGGFAALNKAVGGRVEETKRHLLDKFEARASTKIESFRPAVVGASIVGCIAFILWCSCAATFADGDPGDLGWGVLMAFLGIVASIATCVLCGSAFLFKVAAQNELNSEPLRRRKAMVTSNPANPSSGVP